MGYAPYTEGALQKAMSKSEEFSEERKRKTAVAIQYKKGSHAPHIVAKGKGVVAEKILEMGAKHKVHTHENEELVKELLRSDIGDFIPQELYYAVAQVLVFINELDKRYD